MGKKVDKFLNQNFTEIMDIKFTAKMEEYLDQIASGDIKWDKVLKDFYNRFNPKVEKLLIEYKDVKKLSLQEDDILLGKDPNSNQEIYKGVTKYGPVVKIREDNNGNTHL